jgi:NADPH-dependent ferric siderophore reductase
MKTLDAARERPGRRAVVSRDVVVTAREFVSERMLRLTLGGDDLAPVVHPSPGSWVKLFVPDPDGSGEHGRAYTIRGHDPVRNEIEIDVVLHDGGIMPRWARGSRIGEPARVGGPRASGAPSAAASSVLLLGDETSLPAIAAILEREYADRPLLALIEVGDLGDRQELRTPSRAEVRWLHRRTGSAPGSLLVDAGSRVEIDPGAAVWFAAEASSAQVFRRMLRGVEVAEFHVQGYWRQGVRDYRE